MKPIRIESKEGPFTAWFSGRGLVRLEFPSAGGTTAAKRPDEHHNSIQFERWKKLTAQALREALGGQTPNTLPPLDLSRGTAFQQKVWAALRQIPPGATRTYAQIASAVRKPRASRAVGGACGANPIPIFVPCHRVLAANGGLGGFSSGLPWKRRLLEREGIELERLSQ